MELEALFQSKGDDAEILSKRNDSRFSQIVRNMISHKTAPGNTRGFGEVANTVSVLEARRQKHET